jgi:hypothetical protein
MNFPHSSPRLKPGASCGVLVTRQTDQAAIGLKSLAQNLSNLAAKFKTA